MARPRPGNGRVTKAGTRSTLAQGETPEQARGAYGSEIAPLYKRKPGMFAFMIIACAAMVLSMMAGIFTAL